MHDFVLLSVYRIRDLKGGHGLIIDHKESLYSLLSMGLIGKSLAIDNL